MFVRVVDIGASASEGAGLIGTGDGCGDGGYDGGVGPGERSGGNMGARGVGDGSFKGRQFRYLNSEGG